MLQPATGRSWKTPEFLLQNKLFQVDSCHYKENSRDHTSRHGVLEHMASHHLSPVACRLPPAAGRACRLPPADPMLRCAALSIERMSTLPGRRTNELRA